MAESEWTTITPAYLKGYDAQIEKFLTTYLTAEERSELAKKIVGMFDAATEEELQRNFLEWMKRGLEKRHLGQVEAGELIGVSHTSVGRWLSGKMEMPLDRFRKFYLLFGGDDESDHPMIPVGDLNLRAYCLVIGYLRQFLEAVERARRLGKADVSLPEILNGLDPDDIKPLGSMTFLWLNYYLSSFHVLVQIDQRVYHQYSKWIMLRGIHDHFHLFKPEESGWGKLDTMNRELDVWAVPWLLCLKFLADAKGGVSENYVSATYPARFRNWGTQ